MRRRHFQKFVVVIQLLICIWLFVTPWTAAPQTSLFFPISRSLVKLMFIELVMPSSLLILCHLLFLPSISVFSSESALPIRWPKYWSFGFSISPLKGRKAESWESLFSSFFLIEVIPSPHSSVTKGKLVVIVIAAVTCVLSMFEILY